MFRKADVTIKLLLLVNLMGDEIAGFHLVTNDKKPRGTETFTGTAKHFFILLLFPKYINDQKMPDVLLKMMYQKPVIYRYILKPSKLSSDWDKCLC